MAKYIPDVLKNFDKQINRLNRHSKYSVFSDFLLWVIAGFAISDELNWQPTNNYTKDELPVFPDIFSAFALAMNERIKADNHWADILGEYYMCANISNSSAGQFFTPEHVCTLMAQMAIFENDKRHNAHDCCCGSGRLLLAANSVQLGMKLYASDLDVTCCRMTVVNFLMHGCVGEVVQKDGLLADSYFGGWAVNEGINNPFSKYHGIPHVRFLPKEESVIYQNGFIEKVIPIEEEKPVIVEVEPITEKPKLPTQLTLF